MNQMITLLILTKNRSEFLSRLLYYYRGLEFQGYICIGDASDPYHAERTKSMIKCLGGKLNVVYHEQPNLSFKLCMKKCAESVSTPYTVYVSDDDFLVPNGMEQCVRFLEDHEDYTAAHGKAVAFSLGRTGPYGNISYVRNFPRGEIKGETASQRLTDFFFRAFVPMYGVHRSEAWRVMYPDVNLLDQPLADEGLPSFLSVVQGEIKELACFYLAFQHHDRRHHQADPFDRITSGSWASSYMIVRDLLAEELTRRDGITGEEAREVVRKGWWFLMAEHLMITWGRRYARGTERCKSGVAGIPRQVPRLRSAWRAVRSLIPRKEDGISLQALLRPRSRYHADFMPIYRAVTNPPRGLLD